jgi:hypothetical protein
MFDREVQVHAAADFANHHQYDVDSALLGWALGEYFAEVTFDYPHDFV